MSAKWGWYETLYHLANGDVLKISDVTELTVDHVLTFLAYEQDLRVQENLKVT